MKALLLVGAGLLALLFVGVGNTVEIVAGKRYRVRSKLRGETNLSVIERGLAEVGATDVVMEDGAVTYTVPAKRTKSVRLGVDAFAFEDPAVPGVVVRLVIDELEEES